MKRTLIACGFGLLCITASAQTTTTSTTPAGLDEQSPQENARIGRVAERAPGTIIDEARARHSGLRDNRLEYQHTGIAQSDGTSGSSSSNSSAGGLDTSSLSNLLGSFLSGGGLNLLQGANLFGTSTGTSTSTSTSTGANSNIPSNITPEVIQMLQGAGININDVFPADSSSAKTRARQQSSDTTITSNILLDRWPTKAGQTAQTTDTSSSDTYDNDPNFRVRWSNAMLSTIFTSLIVGMQTPDFINLIKDAIRPAIQDITNTGSSSTSTNKTSTERSRLFPRLARLRAMRAAADSTDTTATETAPVRATRLTRPVRAVTPR